MSNTCCAKVRVSGVAFYRVRDCGLNAKFEHEGKHYCGTHFPPNVKAKEEARQAERLKSYAAQQARREAPALRIKELEAQRNELLEALKELALAYQRTAQYRCLDEVKEDEERFMKARAAIQKAEGKV